MEDEEANIRAPDAPIREQLLDEVNNPFLDEENQMNTILEISEREYISQQYQAIQHAEQKRREECKQLTIKLTRMLTFDKPRAPTYETILTAMTLYESGELDTYLVASLEEYERIMRDVKTVRLTDEERLFIIRLITCFDNCV